MADATSIKDIKVLPQEIWDFLYHICAPDSCLVTDKDELPDSQSTRDLSVTMQLLNILSDYFDI